VNKKLVLSVLSTAVVASMASAAMAKPQPGFYVGGDVDKYYSIDAFLGDHFDDALDAIISELGDTVFVDADANAAPFVEALDANTAEELAAIMKPATVATFNGNVYVNVEDPTAEPYNPATDKDLEPGTPVGDLVVESVSAITNASVKVTFANAVEALTKDNVTVVNKETANKQYIKAVTLSEDKKSATVDFYESLTKGTYTATVKIGEETSSKDFDFVAGEVAKIEANASQLVKASSTIDLTKLDYKVLDEAGLDITSTTDVTFEATVTVTDNSINLADGQTAFVYVVAQKADGTKVKSNRITVKAEAPKPAEIVNFTVAKNDDTVNFEADDYKQSLVVQKGKTNFKFYVGAKDQFGDKYDGAITATYESLDKTVALVDRSTGDITPLKEGTVPVKITFGNVSKTVELSVVANAKASTLELSETEISISNSVTTATNIKVSVKDQYNNVFDHNTPATVTVLSGKDLVTVGSTLTVTDGKGTLSIKPVAGKSGTAVIEVKISESIKANVTVNVTAAGTVDNFVVEGFKATLDKYNNPSTTVDETSAELDVFPVDANGVKTGDEVSATYTVTDKDGKKLIDNVSTATPIDATNSDFKAGETYSISVKVGSIEVFTSTFTVVDSAPKPTVELTSSSLTDKEADFDLFDDLEDIITITGKGFEDAKVVAVSFKSDNSKVIASAKDATSIAYRGEGKASLVLQSVSVDPDGVGPKPAIDITVNEIISASISFSDLATEIAEENVVAHTVADNNGAEVTGTFEDGVYTIAHDFAALKEEQGGAPSVAKWVGVYIEGPAEAKSAAKLVVKGTNAKTFADVEFETETGFENGFFYFFPAKETGNTNDLTIAWADENGNIIKVEKLQVKYENTSE